MNGPMMVWAYYHLVGHIVIPTLTEIINMMAFARMNTKVSFFFSGGGFLNQNILFLYKEK